jgi:hypothetical protein
MLPPTQITIMQLMMIKIDGSELIEHNFDNAAKIFLSTAAQPTHTSQQQRIIFTA